VGRGTFEGDIEEIKFVKKFNSQKDSFKEYLSAFGNPKDLYMIRVTTKQLSKLSDQRVFTRADAYLIKSDSISLDFLIKNDYYLTEDLLYELGTHFEKIPMSGVSVKMTDSNSFQILKVGPHSFFMLFGNYELGAGASLFCLREEELPKNYDLIQGWKTSFENMALYFKDFTDLDDQFYLNQEVCKQIKTFSNTQIEKMINDSKELQKKIFNGYTLYEEPYTAWFFYHGDKIQHLTTIPFTVTTGSGRSHGDYTIVLKPIK